MPTGIERANCVGVLVHPALRELLGNEHATLGDAIADFRFRSQRRLSGLPVKVRWKVDLDQAPSMPPRLILQIMRILQEALSNALHHAGAQNIDVEAMWDAGGMLRLRIADDGKGLPSAFGAGHGIENIRSRARKLDAEVEFVDRVPGTIVSITCPGLQKDLTTQASTQPQT